MTTTYELFYFPGRGRAEPIRMLFTLAGVPFTNTALVDWPAQKASTPLGQLPYLVERGEAGERKIPQSQAILRHLARTFDFYGKDEWQKTMVDYLADTAYDWRGKFVPISIAAFIGTPQEIIDKYWAELPQTLAVFERFLGQSTAPSAGLFVGEKLTFVDLVIFDLIDQNQSFKADCVDGFPGLKAFAERVRAVPAIADYLAKRS
jgi:glutathione S-transferase